jgi:Ran GTPase-activating protein (RanGAP) involved in mRNA processing and transport
VKKLFVRNQNVTNDYLIEKGILENAVKEQRLVDSILEHLPSFPQLKKIDLSRNQFGSTAELGILIRALAGTPIECLRLIHCNFHGISPLQGLSECKQLRNLESVRT